MKSWIKRNLYRLYYYNKKVKIKNGVILNLKNVFEGLNVIESGCKIIFSRINLGTYIADNSVIKNTSIGRFCSIGSNIQTGLGIHPAKTFVSTHPAFFSTQKQAGFTFVNKNIFEDHKYANDKGGFIVEIGNDVWIGNNVIIVDGIKIGDGAIIAAGAVVTKDVEPFAIVGGVPAKLLRYRFTEQQITTLMKVKWWDWDFEKVNEHSSLFADIEDFISKIK